MKHLIRLALLVGGVFVAAQTTAQLPPCDTYCNCKRGCFVNECQVFGFAQSCGDWGICELSCYCGGQC